MNASRRASRQPTENGRAPASPLYKVCRKRPDSRQQAKVSPPGNGRPFPIFRAPLTGRSRPYRYRCSSYLAGSPGSARSRAAPPARRRAAESPRQPPPPRPGRLLAGASGRSVPEPGRHRDPPCPQVSPAAGPAGTPLRLTAGEGNFGTVGRRGPPRSQPPRSAGGCAASHPLLAHTRRPPVASGRPAPRPPGSRRRTNFAKFRAGCGALRLPRRSPFSGSRQVSLGFLGRRLGGAAGRAGAAGGGGRRRRRWWRRQWRRRQRGGREGGGPN